MLFTDFFFLFYFLPLALIVLRLSSVGGRASGVFKAAIIASTLVFYAYENWLWVPLFALVVGGLYGFAILTSRTTRPNLRRAAVVGGVLWAIAALSLLKYLNWLVTFVPALAPLHASLATYFGKRGQIILPPGISFYVFEALSFLFDIYRRKIECPASLVDYLSFVTMFPRFIAGPIVRYGDVSPQLHGDWPGMRLARGLPLFAAGFCLKVLFADQFAVFVPYAFDVASPDFVQAWVGVLAYTMQIYFDFWGYSVMATGLGVCLGFNFPDNFRAPYRSLSINEFWRRWHITLQQWIRDYVYYPLGGGLNARRVAVNLVITMAIAGLWHGANITFVIWGVYHGVLLAIEFVVGADRLARVPKAMRLASTFLLVSLGWVVFRSSTLVQAGGVFRGLFGANGLWPKMNTLLLANHRFSLLLILGALLFLALFEKRLTRKALATRDFSFGARLAMVGGLLVALVVAASSQSIPFLYFQF